MKQAAVAVVALVVCLGSVKCVGAEQAPAAAGAPKIKLVPLVRGLQQPLYLTHDGTDRTFILEQVGRIRLYQGGQLQKTPYLDIAKRVVSGGECGLLGLAFHPDFASNGYFYVNYTTRGGGGAGGGGRGKLITVISEFRADPKSDRVDPSTERIILTFDQPYPNHNGGQVLFGPDGMLYIGVGDGGAAGDPLNAGQRTDTLLGKILRIDVTPRDKYAIPPDNPFVNRPGHRGEIFAIGLRNPWRFSFDRQTNVLYCADVGQDKWEEVHVIEKGGNYGWRLFEGSHQFRPEPDMPKELVPPIKEYSHDLGLSITGGYVYRGKRSPSLAGWYLYGDYSSGRIWGLRYENGTLTGDAQLLHSRTQPASFGEDVNGEIYLCDHNGVVFRVEGE